MQSSVNSNKLIDGKRIIVKMKVVSEVIMKLKTSDVVRTRKTKKRLEVLTYPIAYLQMLVQSVLYKIYS